MTSFGANPNGDPREQRRAQIIRRSAAALTAGLVIVGVGSAIPEPNDSDSRVAAVSAPATPSAAPTSVVRIPGNEALAPDAPEDNDATTDNAPDAIGVYDSQTGEGTIENSAQQFAAEHGYDVANLTPLQAEVFTNSLRTGTLRTSNQTETSALTVQPDFVPGQLPLSVIRQMYQDAQRY